MCSIITNSPPNFTLLLLLQTVLVGGTATGTETVTASETECERDRQRDKTTSVIAASRIAQETEIGTETGTETETGMVRKDHRVIRITNPMTKKCPVLRRFGISSLLTRFMLFHLCV